MPATPNANHLARETSPYLQQHAHNPVDWYPWGAEALQRAQQEHKPILLSIGYSACHWCHVMAHESFEDAATARLMNERFINIKVNREERPDLDKIYQLAHQYLAQRPGGWPLTVILTPDQTPFFAGTYFPPQPRYGRPSFQDVLRGVSDFLTEHPEQIQEQNESLLRVLSNNESGDIAAQATEQPLVAAEQALSSSYDLRHGGFGGAPKFPHPENLQFLLTRDETRHPQARAMALNTLRHMANGGLFDQLGGGFFRYSVDEHWEIPHFEKMLYDNGPLLGLYAQAWTLCGEARFREVAEHTGEWLMREMQSAEGGYYSTLDADTEGHEGTFYLWSREQLASVIDGEDLPLAEMALGLDQPANFEGRWHPQWRVPLARLVDQFAINETELTVRLGAIQQKLFAAREQRVRPDRDEKVLSSWNGLAIKGMALAGRLLDRPDFIASAERALDFVHRELADDGRLLAVYKDGQARLPAYLDDYAFLIDGILALLEARWRDGDLSFALALAETLLDRFEDESHGGFFFTADDHEPLIHRPKPFADESLPSGNGVAAATLARLARLVGDLHYADAAEKTLRAATPLLQRYPTAHGALLNALDGLLHPGKTVILRGQGAELERWKKLSSKRWHPRQLLLAIPNDAADLPGLLASRPAMGLAVAYQCDGFQCSPPITSLEAFTGVIGSS